MNKIKNQKSKIKNEKRKIFSLQSSVFSLLLLVLLVACSPCASLFKGREVGEGRVGKPLAVGDAKYTVNSVSKQPFIQMGSAQQKPDGVYVIIDFTVENISKSTKKFTWRMVNLVDKGGRNYTYKVFETSYLANQLKISNPTLADCQPGVPTHFQIVYDTAVSASGLKLQVRDFALFQPAEGQIDLGQ